MAYGIGPISGCHVNPAVSFGVFVAGRMSATDMVSYWIAQVLGAIVGAVVLYLILSGKAQGWNGGLGQNGWGAGYLGEYNVVSAFVFEVVGTFLFLVCILGVTHPFAPTGFAGLAIGLTLVVIHLVGINITGTSVNPARSIGPALVGIASNPERVAQLWLFIIAPLIGAGAAGLLFKEGALLDAEEGLSGTPRSILQPERMAGQKPAMLAYQRPDLPARRASADRQRDRRAAERRARRTCRAQRRRQDHPLPADPRRDLARERLDLMPQGRAPRQRRAGGAGRRRDADRLRARRPTSSARR